MPFSLPLYTPPDFEGPLLRGAPTVRFARVEKDGIAPDHYHATSIFPEYFQLAQGDWRLPRESRMDCVVVLSPEGDLLVQEFRCLKAGDLVALGRGENGEEGILVHARGFDFPSRVPDPFSFRKRISRETSFSIDYEELYDLLEHERAEGFILWVLGPAVVFDRDARNAFVSLVEQGYVHALLAGNALATHDLEASLFGTALGQEIYSKRSVPLGHYKHLDALNSIRDSGSIRQAIAQGLIPDGIMRALTGRGIPYVLAGSIRDDGPLPEVIADVYAAQDAMRSLARRATTVIALATQLHAIATGNMLPSYAFTEAGRVRPIYFYSVDMSEFAVSKLADRGSLTARSILTNVQDFVVMVDKRLVQKRG